MPPVLGISRPAPPLLAAGTCSVVLRAALMAGTIVGFILARSAGIFGFHLTFSSGLAWTVLIVEGRAW